MADDALPALAVLRHDLRRRVHAMCLCAALAAFDDVDTTERLEMLRRIEADADAVIAMLETLAGNSETRWG